MPVYHLDLETTSLADLPSVGAYRYAVDPSTRILMLAIAQDDGEPLLDLQEHLISTRGHRRSERSEASR